MNKLTFLQNQINNTIVAICDFLPPVTQKEMQRLRSLIYQVINESYLSGLEDGKLDNVTQEDNNVA